MDRGAASASAHADSLYHMYGVALAKRRAAEDTERCAREHQQLPAACAPFCSPPQRGRVPGGLPTVLRSSGGPLILRRAAEGCRAFPGLATMRGRGEFQGAAGRPSRRLGAGRPGAPELTQSFLTSRSKQHRAIVSVIIFCGAEARCARCLYFLVRKGVGLVHGRLRALFLRQVVGVRQRWVVYPLVSRGRACSGWDMDQRWYALAPGGPGEDDGGLGGSARLVCSRFVADSPGVAGVAGVAKVGGDGDGVRGWPVRSALEGGAKSWRSAAGCGPWSPGN
mmetsp:Transcript_21107/g.47503  ORF Transcript_21107/g.47503 Transcript_21107/m.47503 type:complete len:280 (+) Transcript_21107:1422-2261(+)